MIYYFYAQLLARAYHLVYSTAKKLRNVIFQVLERRKLEIWVSQVPKLGVPYYHTFSLYWVPSVNHFHPSYASLKPIR